MTYDTGPMREMLARATKRPWYHQQEHDERGALTARRIATDIGPFNFVADMTRQSPWDADAIVKLRNEAPAMLDTIDAQAAEIARLRDAAQAVINRWHLPTWREAQPTAEAMDALAAALKEQQHDDR